MLKQGCIIVKYNCVHEGLIVYKNKFRRQKREPYTCVPTLRLHLMSYLVGPRRRGPPPDM